MHSVSLRTILIVYLLYLFFQMNSKMELILNSSWKNFELSNFSIMTCCVCAIVTLSVYFTEYFIKRKIRTKEHSIIEFPEFFQTLMSSQEDNDTLLSTKKNNNESSSTVTTYSRFFIFNFLYFVFMFGLITFLHRYATVLLVVQHIAVVGVIFLCFMQFGRPKRAIPLALIYATVWLTSIDTPYRWILNNTIVVMCILLTGYIRFKNFIYLQIFMWLAFVYDVYMLSGINVSDPLQFLSYHDNVAVVTSTVAAPLAQKCSNLLCHVFNHDNNFKIPTAFSIQFGEEIDHVFIGTGDIMIGAFVANFSFRFFKKTNYMAFTVISYGVSVALLSQVSTNAPFPALLTIVPICTLALMVLGVWSNKSLEMILDCQEGSNCRVIRRISDPLCV